MDAIKVILERTPPELAADIIKDGVYLQEEHLRLIILRNILRMRLILMSTLWNILQKAL